MEPNQHKTDDLNGVSDTGQQGAAVQINGKYELILNWYRVNGKNLLDEEVLTKLDINTLLRILGNPIWNDIYHCWAIENKHISDLQNYTQHKFNTDSFIYFIEAYHNT